ncbi:MAG: hypothetical protein ACR2LF_11490 [Jatrophihabitantaceae bacterium]
MTRTDVEHALQQAGSAVTEATRELAGSALDAVDAVRTHAATSDSRRGRGKALFGSLVLAAITVATAFRARQLRSEARSAAAPVPARHFQSGR